MNEKPVYVIFSDKKLELTFERLKEGRFEDKRLYEFINRAIKDLKKDKTCGRKIPKKLWPKIYMQSFNLTNLWKYDLPNAWRLIYTLKEDEIRVLSIILEWFDHKEYEKRFHY